MDNQALNTIIIATATLTAALGGSLITYFINTKKNRIDLKFKKLEYLNLKREKLETAKNKLYQKDEVDFDENENPSIIAGKKVLARAFASKDFFSTINHYFKEKEISQINSDVLKLAKMVAELKFLAYDKKSNPDISLNMEDFNSNNPFELAVVISNEIEKAITKELNKTLKDIEKLYE